MKGKDKLTLNTWAYEGSEARGLLPTIPAKNRVFFILFFGGGGRRIYFFIFQAKNIFLPPILENLNFSLPVKKVRGRP
jgi:hypothetical protein